MWRREPAAPPQPRASCDLTHPDSTLVTDWPLSIHDLLTPSPLLEVVLSPFKHTKTRSSGGEIMCSQLHSKQSNRARFQARSASKHEHLTTSILESPSQEECGLWYPVIRSVLSVCLPAAAPCQLSEDEERARSGRTVVPGTEQARRTLAVNLCQLSASRPRIPFPSLS